MRRPGSSSAGPRRRASPAPACRRHRGGEFSPDTSIKPIPLITGGTAAGATRPGAPCGRIPRHNTGGAPGRAWCNLAIFRWAHRCECLVRCCSSTAWTCYAPRWVLRSARTVRSRRRIAPRSGGRGRCGLRSRSSWSWGWRRRLPPPRGDRPLSARSRARHGRNRSPWRARWRRHRMAAVRVAAAGARLRLPDHMMGLPACPQAGLPSRDGDGPTSAMTRGLTGVSMPECGVIRRCGIPSGLQASRMAVRDGWVEAAEASNMLSRRGHSARRWRGRVSVDLALGRGGRGGGLGGGGGT